MNQKLKNSVSSEKKPVVLKGQSFALGLAFGYAHFEESFDNLGLSKNILKENTQKEFHRLKTAIGHVRDHLDIHVQEAHASGEQDMKEILEAHVRILEDQPFLSEIQTRIEETQLSAEKAVADAFKTASSKLVATRDPYLAARAEDLRDMCINIRKALVYGPSALQSTQSFRRPPVYFSKILRPSYVLRARRAGASGYATASTALTSHAAILLRSSGIPAVGNLKSPSEVFPPGTPVVVDGNKGQVVIWPSQELIKEVIEHQKKKAHNQISKALPPKPVILPSGKEVTLLGNLDNPFQLAMCFEGGLSGIGLFRTEFMILDSGQVPDEETQLSVYSTLVKKLQGRPLTVRTFDIGGDKNFTEMEACYGRNPAMGVRGLRRHLLYEGQELLTQLRALIKASDFGPLEIMAPMVTNLDDVLLFKRWFSEAKSSLKKEGWNRPMKLRLGVMLEIPSAVLQVKEILQEVDFISIGTNDLTQYLTASDRDNTAVLGYQDMESSGILILLERLIKEAQGMGRVDDISVCGELASHPTGAKALVDLGFRRLSISPTTVVAIRNTLESS